MTPAFDPFNDRLARDIRNGLSTQFVRSLEKNTMEDVQKMVELLLTENGGDHYKDYIGERSRRYNEAFHLITDDELADPVQRALALWDQGLFFEVHELLENVWLKEKGERKKALQGLIRAAGMYVHMEQGNLVGAERMAAKAAEALHLHGETLNIKRLDTLLESLNHLNPVAPRLYYKNIESN